MSKRAPIAARTASGQPRPDEDETVTIAPSGMSSAASLALSTLGLAIDQPRLAMEVSRPALAASIAARANANEQMPSSPVAAGAPPPAGAARKNPSQRPQRISCLS